MPQLIRASIKYDDKVKKEKATQYGHWHYIAAETKMYYLTMCGVVHVKDKWPRVLLEVVDQPGEDDKLCLLCKDALEKETK